MGTVQRIQPLLGEDIADRTVANDPQPVGKHDLFFCLRFAEMDARGLPSAVEYHVINEDREAAAGQGVRSAAGQGAKRFSRVTIEDLGSGVVPSARTDTKATPANSPVKQLRSSVSRVPCHLPRRRHTDNCLAPERGRHRSRRFRCRRRRRNGRATVNQPAVARQAAVGGTAAILPDQPAICSLKAIDATIVRADVHPSAGDRGR